MPYFKKIKLLPKMYSMKEGKKKSEQKLPLNPASDKTAADTWFNVVLSHYQLSLTDKSLNRNEQTKISNDHWVACSSNRSVDIYEPTNNDNFTLKDSLRFPNYVRDFDFSKDHKFLIVADYFSTVHLFQYNGNNYEILQNFVF